MIPVRESSWVAIRSFAYEADRRIRFAHTAPWHIEVAGQAVRPREREVEFLIRRVQDEIKRNENVLSDDAMAEFETALEIYKAILARARSEQ